MKDNRQPIILMDYLLGDQEPKDIQWSVFVQMVRMCVQNSEIVPGDTGLVASNAVVPLKFKGAENNLKVLDIISSDMSLKNYTYGIKKYIALKGKNYVVSRNLGEALKRTKYDFDMKYFPTDFCGFISLPDIFPKKYFGALVFPMRVPHDECHNVGISTLCYENVSGVRTLVPGHHVIPILNKKYAEIVDMVDEQSHEENVKNKFWVEVDSSDEQFYKTIMQAVVYIANTDEKLAEEVNAFSAKKGKSSGEKRVYSSLPYIRVGIDFHLPRNYTIDSTVVTGHFRWQPYGTNRDQVKLIYIEPHIRNFNKGEICEESSSIN